MLYLFNASSGAKLNPEEVGREIVSFMNADPQNEYKVMIGTDSEKLADNTADFVTAIVVHRVGKGGRYFWRRIQGNRKFGSLRDRITQEVLTSLEIAQNFLKTFKGADAPKFNFEIHIDIGENGPTKQMIQEMIGMIRAYNFEVRTKPESYAASKVADRHV